MKFKSVSLSRTLEGKAKTIYENSGRFVEVQVNDGLISIVGTLMYVDTKTYRIFEENGINSLYKTDELERLAIRIKG